MIKTVFLFSLYGVGSRFAFLIKTTHMQQTTTKPVSGYGFCMFNSKNHHIYTIGHWWTLKNKAYKEATTKPQRQITWVLGNYCGAHERGECLRQIRDLAWEYTEGEDTDYQTHYSANPMPAKSEQMYDLVVIRETSSAEDHIDMSDEEIICDNEGVDIVAMYLVNLKTRTLDFQKGQANWVTSKNYRDVLKEIQ